MAISLADDGSNFIGRRHRPVCALAPEARAGSGAATLPVSGMPAMVAYRRTRIEGGGEVPLRAEPAAPRRLPVQSDSQGAIIASWVG